MKLWFLCFCRFTKADLPFPISLAQPPISPTRSQSAGRNASIRQRRVLQNVEKTLRLGKEPLTWATVAWRNCYVKVKRDGGTEVKRFPRCFYCLKNEMKPKA